MSRSDPDFVAHEQVAARSLETRVAALEAQMATLIPPARGTRENPIPAVATREQLLQGRPVVVALSEVALPPPEPAPAPDMNKLPP